MPKLKTNKATKKRVRISGSGKIKRSCCNRRHILTSKNRKRKRNLRKRALVHKSDIANVRQLLPYG